MDATTTTTTTTTASTSGTDALNLKPGCTTCSASFDSKDAQRAHMKDDWHIYNMKRRIASLPPISESKFHEKVSVSVLNFGNSDGEANSPFGRSCPTCEQEYQDRKSWHAHLKSRNHADRVNELNFQKQSSDRQRDLARKLESPSSGSESESDADSSRCLFCNVKSTSLDSNLAHMSQTHNFLIPDIDLLLDTSSFLSYLSAIIYDFHECLYCGSLRATKSATQAHMRGKGHCKLNFKTDALELKQFYDFSSSGSDESDEKEPQERGPLVLEDDELRLPSGKILGHRSRGRASRPRDARRLLSVPSRDQNLLTETGDEAGSGTDADAEAELERETPTPTPNQEILDRRLALRAGTSTSLMGLPEAQIRALVAVERKMEKVGERTRSDFERRVERGGNKQKRYKVQSMGKKAGGLEKRLG